MTKAQYFLKYIRKSFLVKLSISVFLIMFIAGLIMHLLEPKTFPSSVDGVWWAIVTIFTVGYGDFVPISLLGRILAITIIIIGTGFVSYLALSLAENTIQLQDRKAKGLTAYKGRKHIVIVGWNERVRDTIASYQREIRHAPIVIIDSTLDELPIELENVFYVKGNPYEDKTFDRANIKESKLILITSDLILDEINADKNTILTILAVKGIYPSIYCVAEILTKQQIRNAKRAGADVVIETTLLSSSLMAHSILNNQDSSFIHKWVESCATEHFSIKKIDGITFPITYKDLCVHYLNKEEFIIGVRQDKELILFPNLATPIQNTDEIVLIKNDDSP